MLPTTILIFLIALGEPSKVYTRVIQPDSVDQDTPVQKIKVKEDRGLLSYIPNIPGSPTNIHIPKKLLNPMGFNVGANVKANAHYNRGDMNLLGVLGAHVGALGVSFGGALGSGGSIGINGAKVKVGSTFGFGTKFGENGTIANGDTPSLSD